MNFKKKSTIIMFVVSVLTFGIILALFSPYIKVEYLTARYGNEFEKCEQQTNILDDAHYHKVFEYSNNKAMVFYVTSDCGCIITFIKDNNDAWKLKTWNVVWSTSGSADGFIWPYYR